MQYAHFVSSLSNNQASFIQNIIISQNNQSIPKWLTNQLENIQNLVFIILDSKIDFGPSGSFSDKSYLNRI